ncbi:MAG: hypothetical protein GY802_17135 [Gammaproteobacteria bacterium]|nr:hypothetical protein [Gammaproteobacteria bacterium]
MINPATIYVAGLIGRPESEIWSIEYYRPLWQAWIDAFNSIPIAGLAILLS